MRDVLWNLWLLHSCLQQLVLLHFSAELALSNWTTAQDICLGKKIGISSLTTWYLQAKENSLNLEKQDSIKAHFFHLIFMIPSLSFQRSEQLISGKIIKGHGRKISCFWPISQFYSMLTTTCFIFDLEPIFDPYFVL